MYNFKVGISRMRCTLVWPDLDTPQRLELISVDNQRNVRSSDNVLTLWSLAAGWVFPIECNTLEARGCPPRYDPQSN